MTLGPFLRVNQIGQAPRTRGEFEREIAALKTRVNRDKALIERSRGADREMAKLDLQALEKELEALIERSRFAPEE